MNVSTNQVSRSKSAGLFSRSLGDQPTTLTYNEGHNACAHLPHQAHSYLEQRLSARHTWEFLDESRSTFYARQNPKDPSYDPLFPHPVPSSTTGRGPRRWKLGAIVAWLQLCESNAADA